MTTTPAIPSTTAGTHSRRRSEGSAVAYLAFLGVVMAVGVDIALPAFDAIREGFSMAAGAPVSLVGTTYFLGMALGQLVIGPAADRFGRNACLKVTIAVSVMGAVGAAFAPGFAALLGARFIWGLGSAGPAVLRTAIARDLFEGDRMAKVVSQIMAVFLLGPILVPSVGQVVLDATSWRGVFGAAAVVGLVAWVWTARFGETLAPENRRPFDPRSFLDGARRVAASRPTVLYIGAQTFSVASFFIFLGSSQPIMENIYGRGDQFARFFGLAGIGMAISLLVSQRAISRFGAGGILVPTLTATIVLSAAGLVMAIATDGVPSFWAWFLWVAATNATLIIVTPICNALALQPMGELAGTASALLGFVTMAGGALAAAVFDALIGDSITPMTVGYVLFAAGSMVCVLAARRST